MENTHRAESYFQDWVNRYIISHEIAGFSIEIIDFETRKHALYEYFLGTQYQEQDLEVHESEDETSMDEDDY